MEAGTRAAPRAPSAFGMGRGIVEGWLPAARGMEVRPGKERVLMAKGSGRGRKQGCSQALEHQGQAKINRKDLDRAQLSAGCHGYGMLPGRRGQGLVWGLLGSGGSTIWAAPPRVQDSELYSGNLPNNLGKAVFLLRTMVFLGY